jgi:SAM-dependent methyltransferase
VSDPTVPATGSAPALELTGERTLPGIPDETYWFERHVVAYDLAIDLVHDQQPQVVLDAGCGEGYGLKMLAEAGVRRVIGVDLEEPVVAHIRASYATEDQRIEAHVAELMQLPIDDDAIDLTVSFQVIEHLHDIPGYLRSLRRVTRPGGTVVIATPNRLTFTPGSEVPVNPFHTREFTASELRDELTAAGYEVTDLLGVHHGPRLQRVEAEAGRPFTDLLIERPPADWPAWLRELVHQVEASWFHLTTDELDASLDLVAVCRVPDRDDPADLGR